jgi:hypothetical protein
LSKPAAAIGRDSNWPMFVSLVLKIGKGEPPTGRLLTIDTGDATAAEIKTLLDTIGQTRTT